MNSLLVSNPTTCYARPFSRTTKNGREVRRVSMVGFRAPRCTMELSIGGDSFRYKNIPEFRRRHIRDPYKLLGLSPDASEEEVRSARDFLLNQYSPHEPSAESIELAYDKIILKSFRERKKAKVNFKSKLRNKVDESPEWVRRVIGFFEVPKMEVVMRRAFLFGFLAGWSILNSGETGPAFQVALSLMACIFFLNDKMKNGWRASLTGIGALVVGWTVGSIMIPLIPYTFFPPTWSLELLTSLIGYFFLFLACVFIK